MRTDESYMVSHFKLYPAVFLLRCHMYTKYVGCPEKCCFRKMFPDFYRTPNNKQGPENQ